MNSLLRKIDANRLNYQEWLTGNPKQMSEADGACYERRKAGIIEFIESQGNRRQACKVAEFSPKELLRVFRRCIGDDPRDMQQVGFRGCVPRYRVKRYTKKHLNGPGNAGRLQALFSKYPQVEDRLTDYVLRRGDRITYPARATGLDLSKECLKYCREAGISQGYPIGYEEGARCALQRWKAHLIDKYGPETLDSVYGKGTGRLFSHGKKGLVSMIDDHLVVVLDEYTIDSFVSTEVQQPDGIKIRVPMRRHKIISARRRGSKDVLACVPVLKAEPNISDFLKVVEVTIRPHKRVTFSIPGFEYPPQPCFASEIPGCEWMLFDLAKLDNSKVHRAEATRAAFIQKLGCVVNFGAARNPKDRPDIEGWHAFLASEFRKLASTTATGPWDTRRDDPEGAAVLLRIEGEHIAQLCELLPARYNITPNDSLKGKTPMEALAAWARDDDRIMRRYPARLRESLSLADTQVRVRIACDLKSGKVPVVRHLYATYRGSRLSGMRSRKNESCILEFNENAAQIATLYDSKNIELDKLSSCGIWEAPHRLSERLLFIKLRKEQKLRFPKTGKTPTELLRDYLASKAISSKDAALKLANLAAYTDKTAVAADASENAEPKAKVAAIKGIISGSREMRARGDW